MNPLINVSSWEPIIGVGAEREKIIYIIDNIASELAFKGDSKTPDLLTGNTGLAIFWEYYNRFSPRTSSRHNTNGLLNSALTAIEEIPLTYTFCSGISGILWGFCHLVEIGAINSNIEHVIGREIDAFLSESSLFDLRQGNYDYLHGGTGSTTYFLDRVDYTFSRNTLSELVHGIERIAIKDGESIIWREFKSKDTAVYNLGLAHGIPSILVVLSRIYKVGIEKEKCLQLLRGAVTWLLNQKNVSESLFRFPSSQSSESINDSRLAWCYGDLGISIALYKIGHNCGVHEWISEAIKIAVNTTNLRDPRKNVVRDAGLCHGTSGIAHIYNRLYQYTGENIFMEAAKYWFKQTIVLFDSPCGLKVWRKDFDDKPEYWSAEVGILEGISGIGLTLLAAISDVEPKWDRSILLS